LVYRPSGSGKSAVMMCSLGR